MANTKISALTSLTGALSAADDEFVIVDTSAGESKRMTRAEITLAIEEQVVVDTKDARGHLPFDTVADLIADPTLTTANTSAGDIIEAQGFRYQVVASGGDVTTAGGIQLDVLGGAGGYNIEAFGALGDGSTDDSAALISANAAATALANGGQILFPMGKTYRIGADVTFASNVTLVFEDGAILQIDSGITVTAPGAVITLGGIPNTGAGTFSALYGLMSMSIGGSLGVGTTTPNVHAGDTGTTTRVISILARTAPLFIGITDRTPLAGKTVASFEGYSVQTAPHDEMAAFRVIFEGATSGQIGGAAAVLTKDDGATTFSEKVRFHANGNVLISEGGVASANRTSQSSASTVVTIAGSSANGVIELATGAADGSSVNTGELLFVHNQNTAGEKRVVRVRAITSGSTANNRGGQYSISVKADGGALFEALMINQAGATNINGQLYIAAAKNIYMSSSGKIRNTTSVLALQSDSSHVDIHPANTLTCRFPATATCVQPNAGTATRSSLQIPHGVAPTAPVDGDMWTTTAGLFVRINGATVGPLS